MENKVANLDGKASEEEAEHKLKLHVRRTSNVKYNIKFESDDGGKHIALYVEVEDPLAPLPAADREAWVVHTWMGWRLIVLKAPRGYIKAFHKREEGF